MKVSIQYLSFLLLPVFAFAQHQAYSAKLGPVEQTGFYRIEIDTALSAHIKPDLADLRIADSGRYVPYVIYQAEEYINNPRPYSLQIDSNKHSYVEITQHTGYPADIIQFKITPTKKADRAATIYNGENNKGKPSGVPLVKFTLSPGVTEVHLPTSVKTTSFLLVIDNVDDLPVYVTSLVIKQKRRYLAAKLEKGKNYMLLADDPAAVLPDYSSQHLKDSVPSQVTVLHYGKLSPVGAAAVTGNETSKDKNPILIWISIVVAAIILVAYVRALMQDRKKKGLQV